MLPRVRCLLPMWATALSLAAPAPAHAIGFSFTQTGFADGATISGHFVGADDDADGWLYASELSEFSLSFSGNRAVESFHHGMDNRAGLVFLIADSALLHVATTGPDDTHFLEYDAFGWPGYHIPGRVTDNRTGMISITWERFELTPLAAVPEPQPALLLGAGLLAAGGLARRRIAAAHDGAR